MPHHSQPYLLPISYMDELPIRLLVAVGGAGFGIIAVSVATFLHLLSTDLAGTLFATIAFSLGLAVTGLVGIEVSTPQRGMRTLDRSKAFARFAKFGYAHRAHFANVRFASEPLLPGRSQPVTALHALCFSCNIDERYSGLY